MSQFYDQASLVVVPSGYKAGTVYAQKPLTTDGQLSFTRASNATRVASNGLIEKVRTNLFPYSQDFSTAAWGKEGTMTETFSQSDPNGGTTAVLVTGGTSGNAFYSHSITCFANVPNTFSIFIKGSASGSVSIRIDDSTTGPQFDINYTTSWQRFSVTRTPNQTGCSFVIGGFNTWGIGENISFAFAQQETGDIATAYIPTTTAAVSVGPVSNVPRLDYLGSSCPRLLLEPQRTNLMPYSEQINTTNYSSSTQVNVTENALVSPDGYTNADLVVPNTTNANHGIGRNISGLTSGATYMCSVFAKAQGYSKFLILAGAGTGSGSYEFNLATGTAAAGATITDYGNGWYRCSAPLVPNSGLLQFLTFISNGSSYSYSGNGTSGIAMYGVQVELGAYATSYIPTLGASVTRVADAASKTGISSLIGQTEGTVFYDGIRGEETEEMYLFLQKNGSTGINDSIYVIKDGSGIAVRIYISGFQVNIVGGTYTTNQRIKIAFAYSATSSVLYVNGVQIGTDSSASIPTCDNYQIGAYTNDSNSIYRTSKPINEALLFKTRLTNAQLAELTTL